MTLTTTILELGKSILVCSALAFLIVWGLEDYAHGRSLQNYLSDELVTLVVTLSAVYTAIIGLSLTQLASLRSIPLRTNAVRVDVNSLFEKIAGALRINFIEMVCQVILAVLVKTFLGSEVIDGISRYHYSWGYFALDIINVTILLWALWLLYDLGMAQFDMFGGLTKVILDKSETMSTAVTTKGSDTEPSVQSPPSDT